MAKSALVTGASGFVGSYVCRELKHHGWHVLGIGHGAHTTEFRSWSGINTFVDADLSEASLDELCIGVTPSVCFHAAGGSSVGSATSDRVADRRRTIASTTVLIDWIAKRHPGLHLIYPSSAAVYGNCGPHPIKETTVTKPISEYGNHKLEAERLILEAHSAEILTCHIVRFFSIYGPRLRKQLLWDIARKARLGKSIELGGKGSETRDFFYAEDAASLVCKIAGDTDRYPLILNGGTGIPTTVSRIAHALTANLSSNLVVTFNGKSRPSDPQHLVADTTLLSETGFQPKTNLDTGVQQYAAWVKTTPILTIVVGTYNRLSQIRECIDSVCAQTTIPFQLFVTDAGSTDGTIKYLQTLSDPRITTVFEGKLSGQAKAYNAIFAQVTTPYVCWISDDNVIVHGGLDQAVAIMQAHPDIGMLGLKVQDKQGPFIKAPYIGGISEIGILNVNQGMLPTHVMRSIGGFSELFRNYGIDPDLTAKVLLSGYKVAYTKSVVIHHYRSWEEDTSTIEGKALAEKQARSMRIYRAKYSDWLNGTWLLKCKKSIFKYCQAKLKTQLALNSKKKVAGALPRDWYNIANSKFISVFDGLKNRGNDHHLVQAIPKHMLPKQLPNDNDFATD